MTQMLASERRSPAQYVQYGCGLTAPLEWTNYDSSLTLRWEQIPVLGQLLTKNTFRFPNNVRFGDIVKGLPCAAASCHGIYASHVLEHLTLAEFHLALINTRRLLKPSGIFRLVVPDLEYAAREYLRKLEMGDPSANEFFLDETCLGRRSRTPGFKGLVYQSLGTHQHGWMWDAISLIQALQENGFHSIRQCAYGDSEDRMFDFVEDPRRFERSVAIEARA